MVPVPVQIQLPQTPEGRAAAAMCVAAAHAGWIDSLLQQQDCPLSQKLELLDRMLQTLCSDKTGARRI